MALGFAMLTIEALRQVVLPGAPDDADDGGAQGGPGPRAGAVSPYEWHEALALLIGLAVGLMLVGVPVAFAFFGANLVGAWIFFGGQAGLVQTGRNVWEAVGSFTLAPVALFLLMGEVMFHTGLAAKAIDAIDRLFLKVPGRLALVAVSAGTVFSSLSGSTMANTAMLGSTLMPEMQRRGYHSSMTMGPILGTGGIAMLIPPSGLAIILGSLSGISISGLLDRGDRAGRADGVDALRLRDGALPAEPRACAQLRRRADEAVGAAAALPRRRGAADVALRRGRRQHPGRLRHALGVRGAGRARGHRRSPPSTAG